MREAELWSTAALVAGRSDYPYEELEEIWRDMLLVQFHDILPGSSIAMVNDEAIASCATSAAKLEHVIETATTALCGRGSVPISFNAAPHAREGVAALSAGAVVVVAADVARVLDGRILENDRIRVELDSNGHIVSLMDRVANREVIPPGLVGTSCSSIQIFPTNGPPGISTRFTGTPR